MNIQCLLLMYFLLLLVFCMKHDTHRIHEVPEFFLKSCSSSLLVSDRRKVSSMSSKTQSCHQSVGYDGQWGCRSILYKRGALYVIWINRQRHLWNSQLYTRAHYDFPSRSCTFHTMHVVRNCNPHSQTRTFYRKESSFKKIQAKFFLSSTYLY